MALTPPALNRYTLHQELSNKAGRRAFLATDTQTQAQVVVKIIQFGDSFQWVDLKLFEREAKILKNLDHPAIPQYKDHFETTFEGLHSFVLVQAYIEAPSLESLVRTGQLFSEKQTIEIAHQLLPTLEHLHTLHPPVVHRDIKPSNILITTHPNGEVNQVYLVDFGSVQITAATTNRQPGGTITIVGSYGYIPLEQFSGQALPSSDLYSLGMTLRYLMTGIHPADMPQDDGPRGKGSVQWPVFDMTGKAISPVTPGLRTWLERLSHPYLDRRFESAAIALNALNNRVDSDGHGYFSHLRPPESQVRIYRDRNQLDIVTGTQAKTKSDRASHLCIQLVSWAIWILSTFYVVPLLFGFMNSFFCFILFIVIKPLVEYFTTGIFLQFFLRIYRKSPEKGLIACNKIFIISINRTSGIRSGIRSVLTAHQKTKRKTTWDAQASPFEDISLFTYTLGYTFNRLAEKGKSTAFTKQGTVKLPSKLSIHAGHREYVIGNSNLSPQEVDWIGQEIGDFLGLKMQVIHPMTKANIRKKQRLSTKARSHVPRSSPQDNMTEADIRKHQRLSAESKHSVPLSSQQYSISRKPLWF